MRVLLLGATGTIGSATAQSLISRGHEVTALVRGEGGHLPEAVAVRKADLLRDAEGAIAAAGGVDAVVSCMASRTGSPDDAWAVDYRAHSNVLSAAKRAGAGQFVLLSAICVQKPVLAFQKAKLAFEAELITSGLSYSIVRPTALFKSLSGQVGRVQAGKPFLVFGDGQLTRCKPISDRDLADFLAGCLDVPARKNAILPVGGPGPAITPLEQGALLFEAFGIEPRFRHVPVGLLGAIISGLKLGGVVFKPLSEKAELARIGRYYATESMLVWDGERSAYDADATPEHGSDTLADHYAGMARGDLMVDLGDHAVF